MLARSGPIPARGQWAFEVKWDGFRALVRTNGEFQVRSRRGWDITELVPELAEMPADGVFDGELVSFDSEGRSDFRAVCHRILNGDESFALKFVVFDVLALDRQLTMALPHAERRRLLDSLGLCDERWHVSPAFDDPFALWDVVLGREYEGIVAKRLNDAVPARRARLGEGEEPPLLALWAGGRLDQAQDRAAAGVRLR
jgi:bifunctional non-homologous end joining protein LigD